MSPARPHPVLSAVLAVLSVAGVVALAAMAIGGAEPRGRWGYVAGTVAFVLSAAQLAPALAMTSRLGRGFWGAPLRRVADVLALAGIITAPALILLLGQLPEWHNRDSIWSDWPGAPLVWDGIASVGLALTGAALVWLTTWPDRHSAGWNASTRQWRVLTAGVVALGAFYTMLAVFVHLLVSADLALSLVPGWHSAVVPAYHVVSGFETAVALVVVATAVIKFEDRLVHDTFRACAKLLLALGLLWFYFVWCELLTNWYGRTPDEQSVLSLFMFGPGAGLFVASAVCEFAAPLLVLMWSGARNSASVTSLVAMIVVVGGFLDRLRIYVGAWSVATPISDDHLPPTLAPLPLPGPPELVACTGLLALCALTVLLVLRQVPAVSPWELKAVERLIRERRVLLTRAAVVARPS